LNVWEIAEMQIECFRIRGHLRNPRRIFLLSVAKRFVGHQHGQRPRRQHGAGRDGETAQKFRRREHLAAGALQTQHTEDVGAGGHEQARTIGAEHRAGCRRAAGLACHIGDLGPNLIGWPATSVAQAGQGKRPLMRAARTAAGAEKSSAPSSLVRRRQKVAAA
jgi:hypothetical protein